MAKVHQSLVALLFFTTLNALVFGALPLIDARMQHSVEAIKSPQFSAEEIAKEIPEGVHWILTDKDGYEFDWDAFCAEHPNCLEAFRLKGIPFPQNHSAAWAPEDDEAFYARQAEDRSQDDHCRVRPLLDQDINDDGCTTDTDCRLKFGGTGGPDPRR